LTLHELRAVLPGVWSMAEFPSQLLTLRGWVEPFRTAGFVSEPAGLAPPTEPLTIYRGTTLGRRRGLSWTTDRATAQWFANRFALADFEAFVFTTIVEPRTVLRSARPPESEVVVDQLRLPSSIRRG
jgi:hypothetical protein